MPDAAADKMIREGWRDLGFFYDCDDQSRTWKLIGSREGLLQFRDALLLYVADPQSAAISEHEHFGPYTYLTVTTWQDAGIDSHAIRGPLDDLARLAGLVDAKLAEASPGASVRIQEEFTADSTYGLLLEVREDGFDPATADPQLPSEN